jgi:hypothetical protein
MMPTQPEPPLSPTVQRHHFLTPITTRLNSFLHAAQSGTNDTTPSVRDSTVIQLMQDQSDSLIQLRTPSRPMELQGLAVAPSPSSAPLTNPNLPSYYNNAKSEDIPCRAIKPPYDGTEENLIPFFTLLNIKQKDEGWKSATFCDITSDTTTIDLLLHFAHVPEQEILQ